MSIFAERVSGGRNFRDTQNSCPISLFLIGQHGKYAIRLEEKYSVKITFPRQSTGIGEVNTREQLKPDEVLVKGGRKGVAQVISELLDVSLQPLIMLFIG